MRECLSLAGLYARTSWRAPSTRRLLVLGVLLATLVLVGLSGADGPGSTALLATYVLVVLGAVGAAAGAGAALPADRAHGRSPWLASTAPAGPVRRLAPALAGMALALVLGAVGGGALGVVVGVVRPDARVRASRELPGLVGALIHAPEAGGGTVGAPLPEAGARRVEVVLRNRYLPSAREAAPRPAEIRWSVEDSGGAVLAHGLERLDYGAPFRVDLPRGSARLRLANETPGVSQLVRAAYVLGPPRRPFVSYGIAGLLLGAFAASLAPVAVFLSRRTSSSTAVAAAAVLAMAGGLHVAFGAGEPWQSGFEAFGHHVLEVAGWLGPDLGAVTLASGPTLGRALGWESLASLLPSVLYALAGLALVLLPLPGDGPMELGA